MSRSRLWNWRWWAALPIMIAVLLPALICLAVEAAADWIRDHSGLAWLADKITSPVYNWVFKDRSYHG